MTEKKQPIECYINRQSLIYSDYYTREEAAKTAEKVIKYLKSIEDTTPMTEPDGTATSLFDVIFVKIIENLTGYSKILYWVEVELDTRYITIPMRDRMINTLEEIIPADYILGDSEPDGGDLLRELWKTKKKEKKQ